VRRGLKVGQLVKLASRRGETVLPLSADDGVAPGQAWLPMHWGVGTLAQAGANALTVALTDPVSKQPALKQAAVSIQPYVPGWQAAWAVCAQDAAQAAQLRHTLQPLLADFDHAAISVAGRERVVVQLRLAHSMAAEDALLERIDRILGCGADQALLAFADVRRGIVKRARVEGGQVLALRFAGEVAALDWLSALMMSGDPLGARRPWLFAPLAKPPLGAEIEDVAAGRIVCSCHGVSAGPIESALAAGASLGEVQERLKCGTSCGSCLPALRRMAARVQAV